NTSRLHRNLPSCPTRRSSDLRAPWPRSGSPAEQGGQPKPSTGVCRCSHLSEACMAHPSRSHAAAFARPRSRRKYLVAAAIALLLAFLAGTWWWQQRAQAGGGGGYRTAAIERGDIRVAISAT